MTHVRRIVAPEDAAPNGVLSWKSRSRERQERVNRRDRKAGQSRVQKYSISKHKDTRAQAVHDGKWGATATERNASWMKRSKAKGQMRRSEGPRQKKERAANGEQTLCPSKENGACTMAAKWLGRATRREKLLSRSFALLEDREKESRANDRG
ncbi:hypothetical protein ERJ75_000492000 [Trypanosoma vivax]|nr:hypothetical protein ERJ75_000492000 [Trypanosoma vivax]